MIKCIVHFNTKRKLPDSEEPEQSDEAYYGLMFDMVTMTASQFIDYFVFWLPGTDKPEFYEDKLREFDDRGLTAWGRKWQTKVFGGTIKSFAVKNHCFQHKQSGILYLSIPDEGAGGREKGWIIGEDAIQQVVNTVSATSALPTSSEDVCANYFCNKRTWIQKDFASAPVYVGHEGTGVHTQPRPVNGRDQTRRCHAAYRTEEG